jgi:hypothetical protein
VKTRAHTFNFILLLPAILAGVFIARGAVAAAASSFYYCCAPLRVCIVERRTSLFVKFN